MSTVTLEIFVERGCAIYQRSVRLAEEMRQKFPNVAVRVVDFSEGGGAHQHLVAATPTFILDGRVVSLGNPSRAELESAIAQLLDAREP